MTNAAPIAPVVRFDTAAAAEYCGLAEATLATKRSLRTGPRYFKLGRKVVYDRDDLDAWMAARAVETTESQTAI